MKLANISGAGQAVETMEAIDYQRNDKFGPELEAVVQEFVKIVKTNVSSKYIEGNKELKDRFNKVVLARTGINAYLITDKLLAATMSNIYSPNSILASKDLSEALSGEYNSMMGAGLLYNKPDGFKVGTVDYKNGRIGGWFSEQPVPVFVNFKQLVQMFRLTAPEITAVIMHELGHDFEGAAMVVKVNTSNQIISDAVVRASQMQPAEQQEYLYKEFSKLNKSVTREDIDGLQSDNPVVLGISAFRTIVASVKSLSGSERHDTTTYEALSDSFAVRFGYGEHLATGLDKLLNSGGRKFMQQYFAVLKAYLVFSVIWNIIKGIKMIYQLKKDGSNKVLKFVIGRIISWAFNLILVKKTFDTERESTRDMTYDLDKDRFIRIRNDMVNSLKDPEIDTKTRLAVLEQIKLLDTIVDKSDNFTGYLGKLALMISPSDKLVYNAIKAQQEVEKMIANDIFVTASKLKAQ